MLRCHGRTTNTINNASKIFKYLLSVTGETFKSRAIEAIDKGMTVTAAGIALIAFGAWNYYQKQSSPPVAEPAAVPKVLPDYTVPINKARAVANASQFRCDGRQHCSQMTSRAEAEFFIRNCIIVVICNQHVQKILCLFRNRIYKRQLNHTCILPKWRNGQTCFITFNQIR